MAQNQAELRIAFDDIKRRAERRTWRPVPDAPVEFRITTVDAPESVSFAAIAALLDYARKELGVDLELLGGGVGCFDMGFTAQREQSAILDAAILADSRLQGLLNELNAHTALIRTQDTTRTYAAFHKTKIALATNRQQDERQFDEQNGVTHLFGAKLSQEMRYGLAEVLIQDLSEGQPKRGLLKRIWRRFPFVIGEGYKALGRVIVQQIDLIEVQAFTKLVKEFAGAGAILMVHGYANNFDDAIQSCARTVYKIKIDHLEFLPILFSWPSRGSASDYLPDTKSAENSEYPLQNLLDLVAGATNGREVDVLAHSHGNKILIGSLCAKRQGPAVSALHLKRLILVEPDVDEQFLRDRVALLAKASDQIVIYHSKNDRVLRLAEILFKNVSAGRGGVTLGQRPTSSSSDTLEVIDASQVSSGLSKHAPHVESPEVINDIYCVLRGEKPAQRFYLRMIDGATGRWQMMRA